MIKTIHAPAAVTVILYEKMGGERKYIAGDRPFCSVVKVADECSGATGIGLQWKLPLLYQAVKQIKWILRLQRHTADQHKYGNTECNRGEFFHERNDRYRPVPHARVFYSSRLGKIHIRPLQMSRYTPACTDLAR